MLTVSILDPSTTQTKIDDFFAKLNSDPVFRNDFLSDPVGVLKKEGFSLTPNDEDLIKKTVGDLRDGINNIFAISSGPRDYLAALGFEIKMPPEIEIEPGIKIT